MITYKLGDITQSTTEGVVNTVNCVGLMGKGIALQFKHKYADYHADYVRKCKVGQIKLGSVDVYATGQISNPKYILSFPTKRHWKENSDYSYIYSGLESLVLQIKKYGIKTISVPPLGCGLGGLDWGVVKHIIEDKLGCINGVEVVVYEPNSSPVHLEKGKKPKITDNRATFIALLRSYSHIEGWLTLLEIQKLAYFLQLMGQPLRLEFIKERYGPYSERLNFVLEDLEGHYFKGYTGSKSPTVTISTLALSSEDEIIINNLANMERVAKVISLVSGFESPYGLELLATVQWVLNECSDPQTKEDVVDKVYKWNSHKRYFKREHIEIAYNYLQEKAPKLD